MSPISLGNVHEVIFVFAVSGWPDSERMLNMYHNSG